MGKFLQIWRFWSVNYNSPWFFSVSRLLVAGRNISMRSGTLRMMRKAHSAAFFFMYAFGDLISLSTSDARSRAISGEAMAPSVHSARPTTNWVLLLRSLWTKCEMSVTWIQKDSKMNVFFVVHFQKCTPLNKFLFSIQNTKLIYMCLSPNYVTQVSCNITFNTFIIIKLKSLTA